MEGVGFSYGGAATGVDGGGGGGAAAKGECRKPRFFGKVKSWFTACLPRLCCLAPQVTYGEFCSTTSTGESLKHPVPCSCEEVKSHKLQMQGDSEETLESIWKGAHSSHRVEVVRAVRNSDGNILSIEKTLSDQSLPDDALKTHPGYGVESLNEGFCSQEDEGDSNCFPRSLRRRKQIRPGGSQGTCMVNAQGDTVKTSNSLQSNNHGIKDGLRED